MLSNKYSCRRGKWPALFWAFPRCIFWVHSELSIGILATSNMLQKNKTQKLQMENGSKHKSVASQTWNFCHQLTSCGILPPSADHQSTTPGHWTDTHSLACSYICNCHEQTWDQADARTDNSTTLTLILTCHNCTLSVLDTCMGQAALGLGWATKLIQSKNGKLIQSVSYTVYR